MFKEFKNFVKQENLVGASHKILLGVSGGVDSAVMADLFAQAGIDFGIAHCNFGLRGQESDEDNSFVKKLAQNYHVPFYSKSFDTLNYADEQSISIQMAARDLRIRWFEEIMSKNGYDYYATAHHLDDQIETLLNNFFRGTGIAGLHGILPKRDNLIHPMLFCFRQQIEAYANERQLNYRVDSSNIKTDYTRNKIRHQLIPVIKQIYPNYQKSISGNIQRISQIETIYQNHLHQIAEELLVYDSGYIKISIDKLLLHKPIEMHLYELIKPFGFNFANTVDIIHSIGSISGKYFLSDSHKITKDRTDLIIEKRNDIKKYEYLIEENNGIIRNPIKLIIQSNKFTSDSEFSKNQHIANFDTKKLKFPLVVRKWEKGDYFYPLGMTQKKLISDFFIDNKVSVPEKDKTWLLISEEQIVWIIGHRIDNRFKISETTASVLTIEYAE